MDKYAYLRMVAHLLDGGFTVEQVLEFTSTSPAEAKVANITSTNVSQRDDLSTAYVDTRSGETLYKETIGDGGIITYRFFKDYNKNILHRLDGPAVVVQNLSRVLSTTYYVSNHEYAKNVFAVAVEDYLKEEFPQVYKSL